MVDFSKIFGASGTNPSTLNPKLGALAPYINLMENIYPSSQVYTPEEQAFLFFTKMAEESSKPGATAIGAAGAAGTELMKTKLASKTLEQKRAGDILTGAVGLTTALSKKGKPSNVMQGQATYMSKEDALKLYPEKDYPGLAAQFTASGAFGEQVGDPIISEAGSPMIIYNTYKDGVLTDIKLLPQGDIIPKTTKDGPAATYVAKEDAKDWISNNLQIGENHPSYDFVYKSIIPINPITKEYEPNRVGDSIVLNNRYAKFKINEGNNKVTSVTLSPDKDAGVPYGVQMTEKRLAYLATHQDETRGKADEIVPLLENPMEQLLSGSTTTGMRESLFLPLERFNVSFWQDMDETGQYVPGAAATRLAALENLQSLSFKLAPLMRPKGSGSTSDMEFKAYMAAILDLKNTSMTNYLNMYALREISKNSQQLLTNEIDLLSDGNYTIREVNKLMREGIDPGIYAKYTGPIDPQEIMDANPGMELDEAMLHLQKYRDEFILNLERGEVIITPPQWIGGSVDKEQEGEKQTLPFYIHGWGVGPSEYRTLHRDAEKAFANNYDYLPKINEPWKVKIKGE